MALAGISAWHDQSISLFHGTNDISVTSIMQTVDETIGGFLKDFGRGFYTTTNFDKARDWSHRQAQRMGGTPAVIRFDVSRNDLAQLDGLYFVRGDANAVDYWSFVQYCRTMGGDHNRLHKL